MKSSLMKRQIPKASCRTTDLYFVKLFASLSIAVEISLLLNFALNSFVKRWSAAVGGVRLNFR